MKTRHPITFIHPKLARNLALASVLGTGALTTFGTGCLDGADDDTTGGDDVINGDGSGTGEGGEIPTYARIRAKTVKI